MTTTPECLPWEHRLMIDHVVQTWQRKPNLYAYLEDDLIIPWDAVQSWARDTELLRKSSQGLLTRGFYLYMENARGETKSLVNGGTFPPPQGFPNWRCKFRVGDRTFVGLPNPYVCFWLMDSQQLSAFRVSPQWHLNGLHGAMRFWGVREAAAFGDGFLRLGDLRKTTDPNLVDCQGQPVVPYHYADHTAAPQLDPAAGVHHLGLPTASRKAGSAPLRPVHEFLVQSEKTCPSMRIMPNHVTTLRGGVTYGKEAHKVILASNCSATG